MGTHMNRRLKILFITVWYPSADNPIDGIFIREHAKAAQKYDDVVVLDCAGFSPETKGWWHLERDSNLNLTAGIPTYRIKHHRINTPRLSNLIYTWGIYRAFHRLGSEGFVPDVIHAHVYKAGFPAVILGKLKGIPVVITEHSTVFPRRILTRFTILIARLAFQNANIVMPVSHALKESIASYQVEARFQIVPNVVDTSLFFPQDQDKAPHSDIKRLLSVALMDPSHKKGYPFLFEALAGVHQDRDDWHLDLVGDGPARKEYEEMVHDLGLADKITFHGLKPKQAVGDFMRKADLFVVPSLFETFSVTTAEALACGTPVVATRCGGPEEFLQDDMGILVPPGDASALAEALNNALNNLQAFDSQHIASLAHQRFSHEAVGKRLHHIYEGLLSS